MQIKTGFFLNRHFIFYSILCVTTLLLAACDQSKFETVPEEKFIGTWEIKGKTMFEGIMINIDKDKSGNLVGKIVELNEDKYVKMFAESGDVWISGIKRSSKYQFKLTEKKIGSPIFSIYGLSTSIDYNFQFIDDNTIGLSIDNLDPKKSTYFYKRKVD